MPLMKDIYLFTGVIILSNIATRAENSCTIDIICLWFWYYSYMQKITPFLWFDNNAEEAMNYYVSVLKIQNYSYRTIPLMSHWINIFQGMAGKVITGIFELNGQQFMY